MAAEVAKPYHNESLTSNANSHDFQPLGSYTKMSGTSTFVPPPFVDKEWYPDVLANDKDRWIHVLTSDETADIDNALRVSQKAGHVGSATMTKEDFPLTVLSKVLGKTLDRLENDLGIFVIRGIPVFNYSKDECRMIYWGIGLHMGHARSQSPAGDMLGDVRDIGSSPNAKEGRGYMSRVKLGFHTDTADIVTLMVLRTAKSGGESAILSSVALHNELCRRRPDYAEELYKPYVWSYKGSERPGEKPYYDQPFFTVCEGKFSSRNIYPHVITAQQEYPEVPRLTKHQREDMDYLTELATEPQFAYSMMFEPGDLQFLNNHIVYHSRTEFEDYDEPDKKRHLLRLWLAPPNSRPLSPLNAGIYRDQRPGVARGGFESRATELSYETKGSLRDRFIRMLWAC